VLKIALPLDHWIPAPVQPHALANEQGDLQAFGTFSTKDILAFAMVEDGVTYSGNRKLKFPLSKQNNKHLMQMIDWARRLIL
jgi:hypothetical protein